MPELSLKERIARRVLLYRANRPLTEGEIRDHLPQKEPSLSQPWFQLTVVRMNSTFLECVDRIHYGRGGLTATALIPLPAVFGMIQIMLLPYLFGTSDAFAEGLWWVERVFYIFADFLVLPLLALLIWGMRQELFRYTHYPLRFNRKTRMVHVFRPNGTTLSIPWDDVYFSLGYCGADYWEVWGHVLAEDGKTVLEVFPLSTRSMRDDDNPKTTLYQQWEFVRRYMENGPQELYNKVPVVFPIHDKRETFSICFNRIFANFGRTPIFMLLFSPVLIYVSIVRWFVLRTCKIPRWPAEVEAQSQIDPEDPWIRDEYHPMSKEDIDKLYSSM